MRRAIRTYAILFGVWVAVAVVGALKPSRVVHFEIGSSAPPVVITVGRAEAFLETLAPYVVWMLLAPAVLWLFTRQPLTGARGWHRVPLHLAAAAAFALLHANLAVAFAYEVGDGWRIGEHPGPFSDAVMQTLPTGFFAYWVTIALALGLQLAERGRQREREAAEADLRSSRLEAQLARSALIALRMELNPHFLFNTLHTIASTVDRDPAAARAMTLQLGALLRITLESADRQEVTLAEELDWLDQYLDIQHARFGEQLRVEVSADPDVLGESVPSLILQPIVENALEHGIGAPDGIARVAVTAVRRGDRIVLRVRDAGPGFASQPAAADGIGLANVRARLQTLYGDAARLTTANPPGGGAEVVVEVPIGGEVPAPA